MKIIDEAPPVHRAEPMPTRSAHAGDWLAHLERAWLDRWNAAGEGAPSAAQRPAVDSHASDAGDARQRPAASGAGDALGLPMAASAPCGVASRAAASAVSGVDPSLCTVLAPWVRAGDLSAVLAPPERRAQMPSPVPSPTTSPMPSRMPSEAANDLELPSARNAPRGLHHAMEPPPARSLLQVWVANTTAQVTLRDASLSPDEGARTGRAVADELRGLGVYAVRIYVNGVESRHGSFSRAAQPTPHRVSAGTADVHSLPHRLT